MTRDELIEKVAFKLQLIAGDEYDYDICGLDKREASIYAEELLDAIYEALKEPTPQMQIVVSKNWGRRTWEEYKEVINASPLNKGE